MISGLMFSTTSVKCLRHIRQSWRSIGGALCRRIRGPPINWTQTNSVDPDQTPQNAASDQDPLFALNSKNFTKHDNKN